MADIGSIIAQQIPQAPQPYKASLGDDVQALFRAAREGTSVGTQRDRMVAGQNAQAQQAFANKAAQVQMQGSMLDRAYKTAQLEAQKGDKQAKAFIDVANMIREDYKGQDLTGLFSSVMNDPRADEAQNAADLYAVASDHIGRLGMKPTQTTKPDKVKFDATGVVLPDGTYVGGRENGDTGVLEIQDPSGKWVPAPPNSYKQSRNVNAPDITGATQLKQQALDTADAVVSNIGRVRDLVKNSQIPVTGIFSMAQGIPGTPQFDAKSAVDTIKANIGFDKLQQMRQASKTGAALGPVSDFENKLLQATFGNLELAQTEEQFLWNLDRIEKLYSRIIDKGVKPGDPIAEEVGKATIEASDPNAIPEGISAEDWKFLSPEERALWRK